MSRNNPFAALAGDDDTSDFGDAPAPKQASKPAEVKKAAAGSTAPAQKRFIPGQSKPQKQAEVGATEASSGAAGFDGERGRDDRGTGFGRGRGGRGRGERGTGARGAGRGAARGGRAERPDRRSQTGREDSAKAEHQGWGGDDGKRELEAEVEGATDAATEVKAGDEAKPAAETNGEEKAAEAAAPAVPAEEEDNSLTYEEYLKQKKDAPIAGVSQIQARKANEGADESQWKDGVVHTKEEQTEYFTIEKQRQEKARKEKARKEKQLIEVEFTAPARQERGGAERGGRGGRGRGDGAGRGRGDGAGRGRGGDRGGRGRGAAPRGGRGGAAAGGAKINVDDDKAFPSLA